MAKRRSRTNDTPPLRFDEKLILHQWMLSLFEVNDFDTLADPLRSRDLEGLDENNVHKFLHQMKLRLLSRDRKSSEQFTCLNRRYHEMKAS